MMTGFLSSRSLMSPSVCSVLRRTTFLLFFGRYETRVVVGVKANFDEKTSLSFDASSAGGSSGCSFELYQPWWSSSSGAAVRVHKRWRNYHMSHCDPSVPLSHQAQLASPGTSLGIHWSASRYRLAFFKHSLIWHRKPPMTWSHILLASWAYTAGKDNNLWTEDISINSQINQ